MLSPRCILTYMPRPLLKTVLLVWIPFKERGYLLGNLRLSKTFWFVCDAIRYLNYYGFSEGTIKFNWENWDVFLLGPPEDDTVSTVVEVCWTASLVDERCCVTTSVEFCWGSWAWEAAGSPPPLGLIGDSTGNEVGPLNLRILPPGVRIIVSWDSELSYCWPSVLSGIWLFWEFFNSTCCTTLKLFEISVSTIPSIVLWSIAKSLQHC